MNHATRRAGAMASVFQGCRRGWSAEQTMAWAKPLGLAFLSSKPMVEWVSACVTTQQRKGGLIFRCDTDKIMQVLCVLLSGWRAGPWRDGVGPSHRAICAASVSGDPRQCSTVRGGIVVLEVSCRCSLEIVSRRSVLRRAGCVWWARIHEQRYLDWYLDPCHDPCHLFLSMHSPYCFFRQLFEKESSTFTYILGDSKTKEVLKLSFRP